MTGKITLINLIGILNYMFPRKEFPQNKINRLSYNNFELYEHQSVSLGLIKWK